MCEFARKDVDATDFCRASGCEEFIAWDFGEGNCYSCKKVGQSYAVATVPLSCNKLDDLLKWLDTQKRQEVSSVN